MVGPNKNMGHQTGAGLAE